MNERLSRDLHLDRWNDGYSIEESHRLLCVGLLRSVFYTPYQQERPMGAAPFCAGGDRLRKKEGNMEEKMSRPASRVLARWLIVISIQLVVVAACNPPSGGGSGSSGPGGGPPSPEPRIEIERDGVVITTSGSSDFGNHPTGTAAEVTFSLFNRGEAQLELSGSPDLVAVTGADAALFTIVTPPATPIASGAQTSFTVRFSPPDVAARTVVLGIASNDPSTPAFTFTVHGAGISPPSKVARTGQTTSYAAGDDAAQARGVAWPSPRFVDNGDGTVSDMLTGLMWQKSPSSTMSWTSAITTSRSLTLASYTDWRLPNVIELESLVNVEQAAPASWLSAQGFAGIQSSVYWTSTTFAQDSSRAWVVYMDYGGSVGRSSKVLSKYSWAVRDGAAGAVALPKSGQTISYTPGDDGDLQKGHDWPSPRFTWTPNNGITDNLTGLMWEEVFSSSTKTWDQAVSSAISLGRGGYSDWRLPNRRELASLINYGQFIPAGWLSAQGFLNVAYGTCWSSSTYAPDTGVAWTAVMDAGNTYFGSKTGSTYMWAVRGGP